MDFLLCFTRYGYLRRLSNDAHFWVESCGYDGQLLLEHLPLNNRKEA